MTAPFRNQARRDAENDSADAAYQAMYETVRAEREAAYTAEFDEPFRIKHPWRENFLTIHAEACKRLAARD